jgi:hypothetical protein
MDLFHEHQKEKNLSFIQITSHWKIWGICTAAVVGPVGPVAEVEVVVEPVAVAQVEPVGVEH